MHTFEQLGLNEKLAKSVAFAGYKTPTPIQVEAIPVLLEGRDLLGSAQTGTGKTAAFAIPILQHIFETVDHTERRKVTALVLAPTRELVTQIAENFSTYAKYINIKNTTIYGGVSQKRQEEALRKGVDVVVATPGRLMDLMEQKIISLKDVKYLVLDEADQMLDMGFIRDIRKIVSHIPKERQSMLFSATMPKEIEKLANEMLIDPVRIAIAPVTKTLDIITQRVYHVAKKQKPNLLVHLIDEEKMKRVLVFTRTKRNADRLVKDLLSRNISSEPIHGNKSQAARDKALANFKSGKTKILVATDVAARGIDIGGLDYVFNYELPEVPETFIHRIGRTGRAGSSGQAIAFADPAELPLLKDIEKHIQMKIQVLPHPFMVEKVVTEEVKTSGTKLKSQKESLKAMTTTDVKHSPSPFKLNDLNSKKEKPKNKKKEEKIPDYLKFKGYESKKKKNNTKKNDAFEQYKKKKNPSYQLKGK